jgi:peroxiredoxin
MLSPRSLRRLLGLVLCVLPTAAARAQTKSFPDDWFFEGTQRPAALKSLEGKPAAEIAAASWIGTPTTLKASKGKVVILDFWATWCGPCMASIPENVKLVNEYKDKDLVFIGVHDGNSGTERAPAVVKDKGINYPIAIDKAATPLSTTAASYSVQFWPTYVAIDRTGTIRAAGLTPNHVEDAVKALLAEAGGSIATPAGPEFAADLYVGGKARPKSLQAMEGTKAPALPANVAWTGQAPTSLAGQVVVIQFTSPSPAAAAQLEALVASASEFSPQGVVHLTVSDANPDAMKPFATAHKSTLPLLHDQPKEASVKQGAWTKAFGVKYGPVTFVVDRAGVIRAAGVKADHLKPILEKLLAEPAPETPSKQER